MQKIRILGLSILALLLCFSCNNNMEEIQPAMDNNVHQVNPPNNTNARMAFNQKVYLLNSVDGVSTIYEVCYDFQGIQGKAILKEICTGLPRDGHLTVSPDGTLLTVVFWREKKIYLIDPTTDNCKANECVVKQLDLCFINSAGEAITKTPKITQVDVDRNGCLFMAGKGGFFKVITKTPTIAAAKLNLTDGFGSLTNIWDDADDKVYAVRFDFADGLIVEVTEDGDPIEEDEYFKSFLAKFNPAQVRFNGGDILFTQSNAATDGFEHQRLISLSQWQGNIAIALDLEWDIDKISVSFKANQVFGFKKADNITLGKVTGAALTGDNMVFTSHHQKSYLNLWNLHGDRLATATMCLEKTPDVPFVHNWGDMASIQSFDVNTANIKDGYISNKETDGAYFDFWNMTCVYDCYTFDECHQYGEVKVYRPGPKVVDIKQYEVLDLSDDNSTGDPTDDYNVSRESRRNSANADIADFRKNAKKFVSLGGGAILLRFPVTKTINKYTKLQVVETSWNKEANYTPTSAGFSAYREKASVYILPDNMDRYYTDGILDWSSIPECGDDIDSWEISSGWKKIGDAYIANNVFDLSAYEGTKVQWVLIKDDCSKTPDGFDLNFISIYDYIDCEEIPN